MSVNVSDVLNVTGQVDKWAGWREVPFGVIVVAVAVVVVGLAVLFLWWNKYYSNVGRKVSFDVHRAPNGNVVVRYSFNELGPTYRRYFDSVSDAGDFMRDTLGELWQED